MSIKVGRRQGGSGNRQPVAEVSNADLLVMAKKTDRGTDAQKARVELIRRGVALD